MALQRAQIAIVAIGYDDAPHVADAVRSASVRGAAVREVIAVDDCSTDGSGTCWSGSPPRIRV